MAEYPDVKWFITAVLFTFALSPQTSNAKSPFTAICTVPLSITGNDRQGMENNRKVLLTRQISLIAEGQQFNKTCGGGVDAGSPLYRQCAKRFVSFNDRKRRLNAEVLQMCRRFWDRDDQIMMMNWVRSTMLLEGLDDAEQLQATVVSKSWSESAKTGFLFATMAAMRGYYSRAHRFLGITKEQNGHDDVVRKLDSLLLSRALAVAEHQMRNPFAFGGIDERAINEKNIKSQQLIFSASVYLGRGEFEKAVKSFRAAKALATYSAGTISAINDAIVWASQLRAQRDESLSQEDWKGFYQAAGYYAAAQRAWSLGAMLAEANDRDQALKFYDEASKYFIRGTPMASVVARQRDAILNDRYNRSHDPEIVEILARPLSRTEAVLDALEYGNRDWDRSEAYLKARLSAVEGNDQYLQEALAYIQGLRVGR